MLLVLTQIIVGKPLTSYTPDLNQSYEEIDDIEYLKSKQKELLKLKENVEKSLKVLMKEQQQIETKISSNEKPQVKAKSNYVDRKVASPVTDLMKRCGSPIGQYSNVQPRVFSHLPENKRPRQLSRSPKPQKFNKPFLNDLGKSVNYEKRQLNTCKSNKSFKPKFKKPLVNHISTPGTRTNNSRDSSVMQENSVLTSSPPSMFNGSRVSSSRYSQSKFGFSSKQYKKLQIIKSCRPINLKLLVGLNRMKYTKFNF